jgi:hypothetical protein
MRKLARWLWPVFFAAPLAALAADDESKAPQNRLLNDRFRITLGGFYAETTTDARLASSTGGAGTDISFEDALGLDKRSLIGEAAVYWRFGERWRLDVNYFNLNRSATRTLGENINWGDLPPLVPGTEVNSSYKIADLRAVAGYSFFRRSDKELGAGVGLHSTKLQVSLDAGNQGAANESVTAPLPVATLYGNFALTDTWALALRADWLSLTYDKYSGSVRSSAVDFIWQPLEHWAFGFGVHNYWVRLDVNNPNAKLSARIVFQGPAAFASYSF